MTCSNIQICIRFVTLRASLLLIILTFRPRGSCRRSHPAWTPGEMFPWWSAALYLHSGFKKNANNWITSIFITKQQECLTALRLHVSAQEIQIKHSDVFPDAVWFINGINSAPYSASHIGVREKSHPSLCAMLSYFILLFFLLMLMSTNSIEIHWNYTFYDVHSIILTYNNDCANCWSVTKRLHDTIHPSPLLLLLLFCSVVGGKLKSIPSYFERETGYTQSNLDEHSRLGAI